MWRCGIAVFERSGRLGEVVEASTTSFFAESYDLHVAPPFGSLVRSDDGPTTIYGVTASVRTTGLDPGRRPSARGRDEESTDSLYHNNPELPELLRTVFEVIIVGFRVDRVVRQYLPARPPRLHGFVHECSLDEVRGFTTQLDFLSTLLSAGQRGSTDELVAALLRLAGRAHAEAGDNDNRAYLVRAGKQLAVLLGLEIGRLNVILRRMRA